MKCIPVAKGRQSTPTDVIKHTELLEAAEGIRDRGTVRCLYYLYTLYRYTSCTLIRMYTNSMPPPREKSLSCLKRFQNNLIYNSIYSVSLLCHLDYLAKEYYEY